MKAIVLLLLTAGCAQSGPATGPPAPVSPSFTRYVADYLSRLDTVYIREADGRLEAVVRGSVRPLEHLEGDTFATGSTRLVLGRDSLRYNNALLVRRLVGSGQFRIEPQQSLAELRRAALAAAPPPQPDTLLPVDRVELRSLDPTIRYDIRYAGSNNFMGGVFYDSASAQLQRPAAEAVVRAHRRLTEHGFGLLVFDAYRPWYVTKMFWDATPDSLRHFVADPAAGSRHNRGAAVDLTLYDLKTGAAVEMPSGYDEFSDRAYPHYPGGTTRQRWHRELLRHAMEAEGFTVYDYEWWHFDYWNWRSYPVH